MGENICRSKSNIVRRYMHFLYLPCTYQNAWISIEILQLYEKWAVNPVKIIDISFTYKWASTHKKFISIQWAIHTYPENMVPHWSATKVYVKVCIAVFHTHQTVLLYFWSYERSCITRVFRPVVSDPTQLRDYTRWWYHLGKPAI